MIRGQPSVRRLPLVEHIPTFSSTDVWQHYFKQLLPVQILGCHVSGVTFPTTPNQPMLDHCDGSGKPDVDHSRQNWPKVGQTPKEMYPHWTWAAANSSDWAAANSSTLLELFWRSFPWSSFFNICQPAKKRGTLLSLPKAPGRLEAYLLYGILNLDKPVNPSSHEAAAERARGLLVFWVGSEHGICLGVPQ